MLTTSFASASDVSDQKAKLVELGRDVWAYASPSDPNCGFVVGDDGVLAVDCRATPSLAREMIADIATVTDKPIKYVALTHYHAVRVMGASAFGIEAIFASRSTHRLIAERGAADLESETRRFPRLFKGADEIPGLTWPKVTFDGEMRFHFGGREVLLRQLGRAHTAGDTICAIPDAGVVFSGDLVENRCGVYTGDAYLSDWLDTLEALRAFPAGTVVPGRGAVMTDARSIHDGIDMTRLFLVALLSTTRQSVDRGWSLRKAYEHTDAVMSREFGDWPLYGHVLPFGVARAYDELRGMVHPVVWTAARDAALWQDLFGEVKEGHHD